MCCWCKHVWFYFWILNTRAVNPHLASISNMGKFPWTQSLKTKRTVKSWKVKSDFFILFHKGLSGLRVEWRGSHLPWPQKVTCVLLFKKVICKRVMGWENQLYRILIWNRLEGDKYSKNSCLDARKRGVLKNSIS